MQQFIAKYEDQIAGTLSGFDRLVLRGSIRRLNKSHFDSERGVMVADGMEYYCWENQILFKNYGDYVRRASERMKNQSLKPLRKADVPYEFVRDSSADKEALAREIASQHGVTSGAVCVLSALKPAPLSTTSNHASFGGCAPAMCCTTTKSTRCWAGCTRASRLGFPSTFKLA